MSTMMNVVLFDEKEFSVEQLQDVIGGAEPVDELESVVLVALSDGLMAAFYVPPASDLRSEGYLQGLSWFQEDLSMDLSAALRDAGEGRVLLFCYEGVSRSRHLWELMPNEEIYRFISDGEGYLSEFIDGTHQEEHTHFDVDPDAFGLVDDDESGFDEEAYHEAVQEQEEPFCAIARLHEVFDLTLDMLEEASILAQDDGEIIWP